MKLIIVLVSIIVFTISASSDGNVPTVANDFVFTFFNADVGGGTLLLALVSNNNNGTASVTVTSSYSLFSTIKVTVAPFSILKIPITPMSIQAQYPNDNGNGRIVVENKGIRLQSSLPVAVYAHAEIYEGSSADTFLVLPAVHLGTQYVAVTSTEPNDPNMIAVVAYQDNTQVTIGQQTVTINALQVASISSTSILSGLRISGNKPFGAISGCTVGETIGAGDYEAVMLLPVGAWGTQFTAIPFMFISPNMYQVVANTDNTILSVSGSPIATLNAGEYRKFSLGTALITSNFPVQLIQLGQNAGDGENDLGDPFFLQLPSTDKMSNTNVLFQPTGFIEYDHVHFDFFLRIVTNTAGTGTIQLDGNTISALQFKRVSGSGFYYYEARTTNTSHRVSTNNPATLFSVISYSYGQFEGCGFACAFSLPVENPAATTTAASTTTAMRTTPSTRCPANWAYLQATNSCYQIFRQQVIWYIADEYCLSLNSGRHLTSIHTQAENDFVVNLAQQVLTIADSQFTWIGLNDIANFNQFKWSDRTPYDFQNWGAGEPIQQQGAENCGVLTVASKCSQDPAVGKWKDIPCGSGNITSFVCKIPSS